MCIVGTVTTLLSVMALTPVLLEMQRYVLTYKFSQDHLELFFNAVRRAGNNIVLHARHSSAAFQYA